MRLLHTEELRFEEFFDQNIPPYAILSHRWRSPEEEISHQDFLGQKKAHSKGRYKLMGFRKLARNSGYSWCWIDTCCIDKSSSAELSEAVNSMFQYYRQAGECFAYLHDVSFDACMYNRDGKSVIDAERLLRHFHRTDWFTRGWTLQELLAPASISFWDADWLKLGTRGSLSSAISSASGIHEDVLNGKRDIESYSIAQRMSWAASRTTSRVEDHAYCLLGLMGLNMPLLYGEGWDAFRRLQEKVMVRHADDSLFAWKVKDTVPHSIHHDSMLAPRPSSFQGCGNIKAGVSSRRISYEVANWGMAITVHRSYDPQAVDAILRSAHGESDISHLALPMGCYKKYISESGGIVTRAMVLRLSLDHATGKWRRISASETSQPGLQTLDGGRRNTAYDSNSAKLFVYDDWACVKSPE